MAGNGNYLQAAENDDGSMNQFSDDEDDWDDEGSEYIKGPDPYWCPVCCTAATCCHVCYIGLFLCYLVVFPFWCKWMLTAPMPFNYWGQAFPDFPRMTLEQSMLGLKNVDPSHPPIDISHLPRSQSACNYSCSSVLHGYETSEMNFEVVLRLNKTGLRGVHATYPVLFASEDFEDWMLVADRRNAEPTPFFDGMVADNDFISLQETCSKPPSGSMDALTSGRSYIVACITWSAANSGTLMKSETLDADGFSSYCDAVGGVCGWPCSSQMDPSVLPFCDWQGRIKPAGVDKLAPGKSDNGYITIDGCRDPAASECATTIGGMGQWKCHKCYTSLKEEDDEVRLRRRRRRRLQPGPPDEPDLPPGMDASGAGDDAAGDEDEEGEDEEEEEGTRLYESLPRLLVKYEMTKAPTEKSFLNTPRAYLFAAPTMAGPFQRLYDPVDPESDFNPPVPVGTKPPKDSAKEIDDHRRAMNVEADNKITIEPSSCYGKRGPMYLVACAINQSTYDDLHQWRNSDGNWFQLGQKIMPPPFNDRCLAVAGRCGHACENRGHKDMEHCLPNGYINQAALVSPIPVQYNRITPVFCLVYVLLLGFAVKTIMLCPGIFSPYQRCHYYNPDMTEQLRYILSVGVTGSGDEGKGTMIRNVVGMVSCLPPECQCRYVVATCEEGHRKEMQTCWQKLTTVIGAIPNLGGQSYEINLRRFMQVWCEELKLLTLTSIGSKVTALDPKILARLSGKTSLAMVKKAGNWDAFGARALGPLEAAIEVLSADLASDYNVFTEMTAYADFTQDWAPLDPTSTPLRMHFVARAKPEEDARSIAVQHVAVGNWYYKVPPNATADEWLDLRKNCAELVYSHLDDDEVNVKVPLQAIRGKAGAMNFVDNYISWVYDRPQNLYNTEQDEAPSLYAVADARHQLQPDFMISCLPCFFYEDGILNKRVGFTQAPQHFPEYVDKLDYLDNNNTQFFRLNAMIRNCCGGVTACGTNGIWQIPHRDNSIVWQRRQKRVRDRDGKYHSQLIEREQFHSSCKISDTASSVDRVLMGEYSHFVNRRLSYGMCKPPQGFLGVQQRWVEGAITLCLQWASKSAGSRSSATKHAHALLCVVIFFVVYMGGLLRLVTKQYTSSIFVESGLLDQNTFDTNFRTPMGRYIRSLYSHMLEHHGGHLLTSYSLKVYEDMTLQFAIWLATCIMMFFLLWMLTTLCRCCRGVLLFPSEMKWWGRLVIIFHHLTYWLWFWTSFFWIGFNAFLAVYPAQFHFNNVGMMSFMLATTILNYALIIANSYRFQIQESVDANEVAFLSMDNIWRTNQLFFIMGPLQLYSLLVGIRTFSKYRLYGQDISGWSTKDHTQVAVRIVRWWTLLLLFMAVFFWIYLFASMPTVEDMERRRPGCIVFTFIAMDVLHPCIFLWTLGNTMTDQDAAKMTWYDAMTSVLWWKRSLARAVLNECTTNVFRFVGPIYNMALPFLIAYNSLYGVGAAFTLVSSGSGH